ncbi:hypothetical protein [Novosphingobium gossypii]|uniref:hypothetical protein n=1 Tax=Novosphingobium gossypii TaxID=1604774 RepID=UPI003D24DC26
MILIVAGQGPQVIAGLVRAALVGGLDAFLSLFVGRIRLALPLLITGLVVLMIALSLMRIGIQCAASEVPTFGTPAFGVWKTWLLAGVVVVVTLRANTFGPGIWSTTLVLIGLLT